MLTLRPASFRRPASAPPPPSTVRPLRLRPSLYSSHPPWCAAIKSRARSGWTPEYRPESHVPQGEAHSADTVTERATRVGLSMVMESTD